MSVLLNSQKVNHEFAEKFAQVYEFRNDYVHGLKEPSSEIFKGKLSELKELDEDLVNLMNG